MQKTPELIIEAFENRQDREAASHRRKLRRRAFAMGLMIFLGMAVVILGKQMPLIMSPALTALFVLGYKRQQQWTLEDRQAAL